MIFVDSSFWVALAAKRDQRHGQATTLLGERRDERFVTSNHVRGEVWTFVNRRYGHNQAVRYLDAIEQTPRVHVEHVSEALELTAIRWLRARDEREYSFVDSTSFALMRDLGIREALAFDGDFAAAGFIELRA